MQAASVEKARREIPRASSSGETLTASRSGSRPSVFPVRQSRAARASTHSPIGTIRSLDSSAGRKLPGGTMPRSGSIQRSSASTPTIFQCAARSEAGSKLKRSCPARIAMLFQLLLRQSLRGRGRAASRPLTLRSRSFCNGAFRELQQRLRIGAVEGNARQAAFHGDGHRVIADRERLAEDCSGRIVVGRRMHVRDALRLRVTGLGRRRRLGWKKRRRKFRRRSIPDRRPP